MSKTEQIVDLQVLTKSRFFYRPGEKDARVFVLLHGYMQTQSWMWEQFQSCFPEDSHILSLNGPFPVPNKKGPLSYELGYAWYFFDPFIPRYFVGHDVGVDLVGKTLSHLSLFDQPTTILGFSQGGYISPSVGLALPQVDHVIGLSCRFVTDMADLQHSLQIDAIHGQEDQMVELDGSKEAFEKLPPQVKGRYREIPGLGHFPNTEMVELVTNWVQEKK